ncbi:MAG: hypothetical protein QOK23_4620 [Gammaproteobacteria bacterium]|jgi:hypothetical protein|nr:hypothetical protein [Gammaproteobacteria bacterium]
MAQMSRSVSGAFCSTSLPLLQGSRQSEIAAGANMMNSHLLYGSSKREIHAAEGIPRKWPTIQNGEPFLRTTCSRPRTSPMPSEND